MGVAHLAPLADGLGYEPDGAAAEAVGAPAVEGQEVAAFGVVGLEVIGLETPSRAQAVCYMPASAKLPAAIEPAAVEQDALTH